MPQPEAPKAGPRVYDINDQVKVVAKWWRELQQTDVDRQKKQGNMNAMRRPQIPINDIAKKLISWNIFMDMSAARRYLIQAIGDSKEMVDFENFNAVFIKGIFKDVISSIANTVQNYRRKDEKHLSDEEIHKKPLLWKLSDYKRENLFEMMAKGMVKNNVEP
jgi:hypothetical protein